jgi:hypothetical protein
LICSILGKFNHVSRNSACAFAGIALAIATMREEARISGAGPNPKLFQKRTRKNRPLHNLQELDLSNRPTLEWENTDIPGIVTLSHQ